MSLLLPSIGQPRAAGAPPERASFLHRTGSPAQRELPIRKSLVLLPSYGKPRAAGDPSNSRASSALPLSSSPAQRELPQKWPPPSSLY